METIVIIGNGIAGVSAARHMRKHSDKRIIIVSAETDYFFSRTALMYVYMGHMKFEHIQPYEDWFWNKNRIELVRAFVSQVDTEKKQLLLFDGVCNFCNSSILKVIKNDTNNIFLFASLQSKIGQQIVNH